MFKISVVGCGSVGATTAYSLLLQGISTEMVLIDVNKEKAEGLLLDLEHALSFSAYTKISASSDFRAVKNSHLIVITAGARQAPGETRLDLVKKNTDIFKKIIPQIAKAAPNAILLIVTNPVDVMTFQALKLSKFPSNQVFGSGTILDTVRFQFHISCHVKIHPKSIDAYILGEHGDSSFPVWSSANILGKPLETFKGFDKKLREKCYQDTKNAAYRIIHDLGYTCYSIATAITEIARNIRDDSHMVFPLSVLLKKYHGESDLCLSVPSVLGRKGIEEIITIPLDKTEMKQFHNSAKIIKSYLKNV